MLIDICERECMDGVLTNRYHVQLHQHLESHV